jgi:hypothetical protein
MASESKRNVVVRWLKRFARWAGAVLLKAGREEFERRYPKNKNAAK